MKKTYSPTLTINKVTASQLASLALNSGLHESELYVVPEQPLTITLNNGTTEGTNKFTYDGLTAKTINIPTSSLNGWTSSGSSRFSNTDMSEYISLSPEGISWSSDTYQSGGTFIFPRDTKSGGVTLATLDDLANSGGEPTAITNISRSGTTFTATRANGTTFTFTQQDNNSTTKLIAGTSTSTANATTTNTTTYLRLFDGTTARNSIQIKGTGGTTVSATGGVITIDSASSGGSVTATTANSTKSYLAGVNATGYTSGSAVSDFKVDTGVYLDTTSGRLTAASFYSNSDKRLKENIVEYTPKKSVLDLPLYKYNYISDPTKTQQIGCLAQDLQEICPEAVHTDEDGYLTISESKIVYLLLDEVKKLKAEVEELKANG